MGGVAASGFDVVIGFVSSLSILSLRRMFKQKKEAPVLQGLPFCSWFKSFY
jgi:hypothetical protein